MKHTNLWRQKWNFVVDGCYTGTQLYTYHNSEDEACEFTVRCCKFYLLHPTGPHARPVGVAHQHPSNDKPLNTFLLAPKYIRNNK